MLTNTENSSDGVEEFLDTNYELGRQNLIIKIDKKIESRPQCKLFWLYIGHNQTLKGQPGEYLNMDNLNMYANWLPLMIFKKK